MSSEILLTGISSSDSEKVLIIAIHTIKAGILEVIDSCCHGLVYAIKAVSMMTVENESILLIVDFITDLTQEFLISYLGLIPDRVSELLFYSALIFNQAHSLVLGGRLWMVPVLGWRLPTDPTQHCFTVFVEA